MADLQEFKQKYPDIYAAVHDEGKQDGYAEGLEEGKKLGLEDAAEEARQAGAAAERERIKAVRDQLIPGHEALIESLMFDGETTGPEAAVKVLAAEKAVRLGALNDLKDDAPEPLPDPAVDDNQGAKGAAAGDDELPLEEKCKAVWEKDGKLRVEFDGDFDAYLAAEKAMSSGTVRIISGKE